MDLLGQKLSGQLNPYGPAEKLNISNDVYMQVLESITDFHGGTQKLRSLRYDIKLCIRAFFYENQEQ